MLLLLLLSGLLGTPVNLDDFKNQHFSIATGICWTSVARKRMGRVSKRVNKRVNKRVSRRVGRRVCKRVRESVGESWRSN